MALPRPKLILWTGPKHSDKTSSAAQLAERARSEGLAVAGLLAPAVHRGGSLVGFDILSINTGVRVPLVRRDPEDDRRTMSYPFAPEGLELGRATLGSMAARSAALVIVDEFGPLELRGEGWREAVDSLVATAEGVVLLVVREGLVARVAQLYAQLDPRTLLAARPGSIDSVIGLLKNA